MKVQPKAESKLDQTTKTLFHKTIQIQEVLKIFHKKQLGFQITKPKTSQKRVGGFNTPF